MYALFSDIFSKQSYNNTVRCYVNGDTNVLCDPSFVQNPMGSTREVTTPPLGGNIQVTPSVVDVSVRPGQFSEQESVGFSKQRTHDILFEGFITQPIS